MPKSAAPRRLTFVWCRLANWATFLLLMARILLIDDDPIVRTMLCRTLNRFGHTVIEATGGREALALFPQSQADLVITDLIMADRNGTEVIEEIKRVAPPVKIIAISAGGLWTDGNNLATARAAGAIRTFAKPFPLKSFIEAIEELVPASPCGSSGDGRLGNGLDQADGKA